MEKHLLDRKPIVWCTFVDNWEPMGGRGCVNESTDNGQPLIKSGFRKWHGREKAGKWVGETKKWNLYLEICVCHIHTIVLVCLKGAKTAALQDLMINVAVVGPFLKPSTPYVLPGFLPSNEWAGERGRKSQAPIYMYVEVFTTQNVRREVPSLFGVEEWKIAFGCCWDFINEDQSPYIFHPSPYLWRPPCMCTHFPEFQGDN